MIALLLKGDSMRFIKTLLKPLFLLFLTRNQLTKLSFILHRFIRNVQIGFFILTHICKNPIKAYKNLMGGGAEARF